MPNITKQQHVFISTGNPDTMNDSSMIRPGELGMCFDWNDKSYQIVKVDSGATVGPTVGAVAANQLAFWKDRSTYLVTNDKRFASLGGVANSFANNVAGVFRVAATGGYYCCVLKKGYNIAAAATAGTTAGELVVADTTADTAYCDGPISVGTAITYSVLGVCKTSASANVAYVNFDIPDIP